MTSLPGIMRVALLAAGAVAGAIFVMLGIYMIMAETLWAIYGVVLPTPLDLLPPQWRW